MKPERVELIYTGTMRLLADLNIDPKAVEDYRIVHCAELACRTLEVVESVTRSRDNVVSFPRPMSVRNLPPTG